MLMLQTKMSRKNGAACTQADFNSIIPSIGEFAVLSNLVQQMQTEGKIIYRASQLNGDDQIETVTLFRDQAAYDEMWGSSERAALLAFIQGSDIYMEAIATTEEV